MAPVKCSHCKGTGRINVLCALRDDGKGGQIGGPDVLRCPDCKGDGLERRRPEWIVVGAEMRRQRVEAGLSLREKAKALGVSVVTLSEMEHGRIEPGDSEPGKRE